MIFISLANILNIFIILMMIIVFFNYSSAKKSKLLFQYIKADDENYDDYFNRHSKLNEKKLTIFEFYVTKYNLEVQRILLLESDETLSNKLTKINNYCKNPGEYNEEKFLESLEKFRNPVVEKQNQNAKEESLPISTNPPMEQSESALKEYRDSLIERTLKEYRDPVVETKNYCLKAFNDLFQNLMICLSRICTDESSCSYLPNNKLVTTVPKILITLQNALKNQNDNADATTSRSKGLKVWSLVVRKKKFNEEIIDKIVVGATRFCNDHQQRTSTIATSVWIAFGKSMLLTWTAVCGMLTRKKLTAVVEDEFYRCIMDFKNDMIRLNKKITEKNKKELITLENKTISNDKKKQILEYGEIILLKMLSLSSDGKITPKFIHFWFPILTNHELTNLSQKSCQKDCKGNMDIDGKFEVSKNKIIKPEILMDDNYAMLVNTCRAIKGERDYTTYVLRLTYFDCIPLTSSLWKYELQVV